MLGAVAPGVSGAPMALFAALVEVERAVRAEDRLVGQVVPHLRGRLTRMSCTFCRLLPESRVIFVE